MQKTPIFITFPGKKRSNWEKIKKKAVVGINCGPWPIFPNTKHLTHFYIWVVKCSGHFFFILFLGKTGQITRYLEKKTYGHQLGPMTHFLTTTKFDLLLYIGEMCLQTHLQSFLCALITDLKKFDPKKVISVKTHHLAMWATSLSRTKYFGTSPKLPVHALIHDP